MRVFWQMPSSWNIPNLNYLFFVLQQKLCNGKYEEKINLTQTEH